MINKLKRIKKDEKGDILILYALLFVVIMGFLSFAVDLGLMYMHRMRMYEIGNVMRQTRFTKNQYTNLTFLNSENPGERYANIFNEYARKNGFKGSIRVRYDEKHPYYNNWKKREYKIDMWLEDVYETTTLRALNINSVPIKVHIAGYGHSEQSGTIWAPKNNKNFTYYETTFPATK